VNARIVSGLAAAVLFCSAAAGQGRRGAPHPAPAHGPKAIDGLEELSPQQRQKIIDSLPPDRARKAQDRLDQLNRLTPEERARLKEQYGWFQQLPPERQEAMRKAFRKYSALAPERQDAVRQEFRRLQDLPTDARRDQVASQDFRSRFSKDERKLIQELAGAVPR
jgi:hypothetical protein